VQSETAPRQQGSVWVVAPCYRAEEAKLSVVEPEGGTRLDPEGTDFFADPRVDGREGGAVGRKPRRLGVLEGDRGEEEAGPQIERCRVADRRVIANHGLDQIDASLEVVLGVDVGVHAQGQVRPRLEAAEESRLGELRLHRARLLAVSGLAETAFEK
jgi:hypothetical protein